MSQRHVVASGPRAGQWDTCHAKISCKNGGVHLEEQVLKTISERTYTPVKELTVSDVQQFAQQHPEMFPKVTEGTTTAAPQTISDPEAKSSTVDQPSGGPPPLVRMQLGLNRIASEIRRAEAQGESEATLQQMRREYQTKLTQATSHLERVYAQDGEPGIEKIIESTSGLKVLCNDIIDSHTRERSLFEGDKVRFITQKTYDAHVGAGLEALNEWNEAARDAQDATHAENGASYRDAVAERRRAQRDVLTSMRVITEVSGQEQLRRHVRDATDRSSRTLALYASETALRSRPSYAPTETIRTQEEAEALATQINTVLDIAMEGEDPQTPSTAPSALMRGSLTKVTALAMYKDAISEYKALDATQFNDATDRLTSAHRHESIVAARAVIPNSVSPQAFTKASFNPNVRILLQDVSTYKTKQTAYLKSDPRRHDPQDIAALKTEMLKAETAAHQSVRLLALATRKEDLPTLVAFLRKETPDFA